MVMSDIFKYGKLGRLMWSKRIGNFYYHWGVYVEYL